jgi:hypothetical protein
MSSSKRCSDCKELKPLGEFHKRKASPDGLAYRCRDCVNKASVEWRTNNPGAYKVWAEKNKDSRTEYQRVWYAKNRDAQPARFAKWARANAHRVIANIAKRRAAKKHATPAWANLTVIEGFYKEAARLTKETGIRHEVDHIIPLQGKFVCGFHCEDNLQILTRSENACKRNKMPTVVT